MKIEGKYRLVQCHPEFEVSDPRSIPTVLEGGFRSPAEVKSFWEMSYQVGSWRNGPEPVYYWQVY